VTTPHGRARVFLAEPLPRRPRNLRLAATTVGCYGSTMANLRQMVNRWMGWSEDADHVKLGAGVIGHGRAVMLGFFAMVAVVAAALSSHTDVLLQIICIGAALVFIFLLGSWIIAWLQPDHALMGGSDLRRIREIQMAAQGHPSLPLQTPVPDPMHPVTTVEDANGT
jgi:hypothetical protein